MSFMKRLVFGFLVFMIGVGVAWAGERGYQLVTSRDSKLCAKILEAFREDVDDRGGCDISTRSFGRSPGSLSS